MLGTLDQPPPKVNADNVEQILVSRGDHREPGPNIAADRVVGIFRADDNGNPSGNIQHVMYSIGNGMCQGSNNACIGPYSPQWDRVDLNESFDWELGFPRQQNEVNNGVADRFSRRVIVSISATTAAQRLSDHLRNSRNP
ncbi:MAG TPA: hypothetical protein DCE56_24740 [Cyanobacteria bacterium UBA8553]|nr:hypothetical protein [Cyanobacteria bacterium UBA8553]